VTSGPGSAWTGAPPPPYPHQLPAPRPPAAARKSRVPRQLVSAAVALIVLSPVAGTLWATGGLRAAPRIETVPPGEGIDQGLYRSQVMGAVVHHKQGLTVDPKARYVDIFIKVTNLDKRTRKTEEYDLNAITLDIPFFEQALFRAETTQSSEMLPPGSTKTVALTTELDTGQQPPKSYRILFHQFEHRKDFFYAFTDWKPVKSAKDPKGTAFAQVVVPVQVEA
jgi:hypothetical protein